MKQYSLRRKDKEIINKDEILSILKQAQICRLGLSEDNFPYVIPINFVYEEDFFYFHCAKKGRKIDILKKNPQVCIEIDEDQKVVIPKGNLLQTTMAYRSIIAFGKAILIDDSEEKNKALQLLLSKYTNQTAKIPENMLKQTGIIKVEINYLTAKGSD